MSNNDDHSDLFGLLFGYMVYRELRDGRLDAGDVLRAGCLVTLIIGGVLGAGLILISALSPRYPSSARDDFPVATFRPVAPPVTEWPTLRPLPTVRPTPSPTPAPTPQPLAAIGSQVDAGDGWLVTVTKVERWRPSSYREPGWRLITAHLEVVMPAIEYGCVFPSMFWLEASGGERYEAWEVGRKPHLFDCTDYHRPTKTRGWLTFEIRDADAQGLVLGGCPDEMFWCEDPVRFQLP